MNNMFKNLAIWLVIGLVLMTVFNQFNTRQVAQGSIEYSQFLDEVKQGHINKVVIEGRTLKATTTEGKRITSYAPPDLWMVSDLLKNGVKIEAKPEEEPSFLMNIFVSWFPMLLLIGVWIFLSRQMQGGAGKAMGFGKSKAKLLTETLGRVTFEDVAGVDEGTQTSGQRRTDEHRIGARALDLDLVEGSRRDLTHDLPTRWWACSRSR